jgi:hypothetical protein
MQKCWPKGAKAFIDGETVVVGRAGCCDPDHLPYVWVEWEDGTKAPIEGEDIEHLKLLSTAIVQAFRGVK